MTSQADSEKPRVAPGLRERVVRHVAGRLLPLAALLVCICLAYFVHTTWQARELAEEQVRRHGLNLAALLAAQTADGLAQAARTLEQTVSLAPAAAGKSRRDRTPVELRRLLETTPQLRALGIYDRQGKLLLEMGGLPNGEAGQDFLKAHAEAGTDLVVQSPWRADRQSPAELPISRVVRDAAGAPVAYVVGLLESDYFQQLLARADLGEGGIAAVVLPDGAALVRTPEAMAEVGNREFAATLSSDPGAGSGQGRERSAIDGIERLISFYAVGSTPLNLVIGMPVRQSFAQWRLSLSGGAALLGALAVLAVAPPILFKRHRRRSQRAIDAAERRFRDLADNLPGMVFIMTLSPDGGIRMPYVSQGARTIFGLAPEEITAEPDLLLQSLEPADRERFVREINLSLTLLEPWTMDFPIHSHSGEAKWVQGISHPTRKPDGSIVWTGFVLDITNRKQIDATLDAVRSELQEKNRQFDVALNNMIQGLTLYDAQERLVVSNQRYRELYNLPEAATRPFMTLTEIMEYSIALGNYAPEVGQKVMAERLALERAREPRRVYQRQRNGRTVEVNYRPLPYGGSVSTFTDVTEEKRREEELAAKSALLQVTLERIDEGISVFDGNERLLAWNDQFLSLLDLPQRFAKVGTPLSEIVNYQIETGEYSQQLIDGLTTQGRHLPSTSWERTRPNGRILACHRNPMPDGGFVTVYRDITSIKQAQTALRKAKEEAEQADRTKSVFLANMSHELRTPLNAIIGFSEIIRDQLFGSLGNERYKEYASDIHDSGSHLLALINDVLDMSKIEAGRVELEQEDLDLLALIESCIAMVRARADEGRVAIEVHAEGMAPIVYADERSLKQVMLNLLSNGVKFTPSAGKVSVRFALQDGELAIIVSDTGIGIGPEALHRVLQPFAQAEASTSRRYGGTGLGLSISKALVELHGGRLTMSSALGEGTHVVVSLPANRIRTTGVAQDIVRPSRAMRG